MNLLVLGTPPLDSLIVEQFDNAYPDERIREWRTDLLWLLEAEQTLSDVVRRFVPDLVVNAGLRMLAIHPAVLCEGKPEEARQINVGMAAEAAILARGVGCPLVHLSTHYVFDGESGRPYTESDPAHPVTRYGQTMLSAEEQVLTIHPTACVLRIPSLYHGSGGLIHEGLLRSVQAMAIHRRQVAAFEDVWVSPTPATLVADAVERAHAKQLSGVFHVSPSGCATEYEVAQRIYQAVGSRTAPIRSKSPGEIQGRMAALDGSVLARAAGMEVVGWEEYLDQVMRKEEQE